MGSRIRRGDNKKADRPHTETVLTSHERMRQQLARDVDEFLAHGGHITELEPHIRSGRGDGDQESF